MENPLFLKRFRFDNPLKTFLWASVAAVLGHWCAGAPFSGPLFLEMKDLQGNSHVFLEWNPIAPHFVAQKMSILCVFSGQNGFGPHFARYMWWVRTGV